MINSAASLIECEIATADDIDTGMKLGAGFPEGICRRADEIGLDVVYTKLQHLYENEGADRHEPTALLREMVASGRTGQTVGEGFFTYDEA